TDILKEVAEDLKLRDINLSAHSLRKTFAYRVWMENGKDIFYVKELLGHSTVEYTKRYLGLDIELYGRTLSSLNNLIL
ncbi:MAG: tyrosine-type recombinase/integrase, partial [Clostridium celatum]|nr:tyrosine-type recombinase/integrase [Clostridium celatum]